MNRCKSANVGSGSNSEQHGKIGQDWTVVVA
jgi:hypothetical protein